ncbi:hypothetical protein HUT18_11555 [Streptomyces sp. NA04227]|uniref:hypothetical protein n=1 Tax=Streptomyces sp. NA04227 TaxID=2742136 RepID=UPI001592161D|nr:hypothetical protein [Streptomyces sp. NA04227]QKW06935.1 hypothetical protein HUT18_11555 [Streptomyces sp. NA04227]
MIHVRPAPEQRQPLAAWAVAQSPKVRTAGPNTFAVPARLFPDMPESVLIGAEVDGYRYRPVSEDDAAGAPPPSDLLGVATAEGLAEHAAEQHTAEPEPPHVIAAPAGCAAPAPLPTEPPSDVIAALPSPRPAPLPTQGSGFPCDRCSRRFATKRGRNTHHRQKHSEG